MPDYKRKPIADSELEELRLRVDTEKCRRSLKAFAAGAWPVVEPAVTRTEGWHLDCINEHLQACSKHELRRLIINIPPRHSKSLSVAVFWPMWTWTFNPASRWLYASYSESLSIRDSLKCRRLIQSSWYQNRFGKIYNLSGDQNVKARFENDHMGYRLATSVGGSITGEGGEFIVCDDPHNVLTSDSEVIRHGVLSWWDEVMSTRLNDPKTGVMVVVMQRVHEDDLTGHLIKQGGWHHLCLPARYEPRNIYEGVAIEHMHSQPHDNCKIFSDPRTREGELLWPERFAEEDLKGLEAAMGSYAVASQLQQRPAPREGGMFKSSWIKPLPSDFDLMEPGALKTFRQRINYVQFWDLAFSRHERADYTAAVTVGVGPNGEIFITDVWRSRVNDTELALTIANQVERVRPDVVVVEEAAYRQLATQVLVRRVQSLLRRPIGVTSVPVTTDKIFRAQLPIGKAQAGMLFADRLAEWWPDFEAELNVFPNGSFDDQCLPGEALIATQVGLVPIAAIKPGVLVATRAGWGEVLRAEQTGYADKLVSLVDRESRALQATPNHPIWTGEAFVPASQVLPGGLFTTVEYKEVARQPVYNIYVDQYHEYYANGILVHNCDALAGAISYAVGMKPADPIMIEMSVNANKKGENPLQRRRRLRREREKRFREMMRL